MTTETPRATIERRGLEQPPAVEQNAGRPVLSGYACKFDVLSELLGRPPEQFREVFRASALRRLGQQRDIKFLAHHDSGRVLGSTRAGNLRLRTDAIGLRFELDPPNSPAGLDLVESVRRGDISGMSIGFKVPDGGERWTGNRPPTREILDADCFEISAFLQSLVKFLVGGRVDSFADNDCWSSVTNYDFFFSSCNPSFQ